MPRRDFRELQAGIDPERLARSRRRAAAVLAEIDAPGGTAEITVADLRRRAGRHEAVPAGHAAVADDDLPLSAVVRLVRELGGELEVVAHLPDGDVRVRATPATATAAATATAD